MKYIIIVTVFILMGIAGYFYFDLNHDYVEEMAHFHGKTEQEVVDILGVQDSVNSMRLKHGVTLPEKYIEIHNTYDPNDIRINNVEIREYLWDDNGYTISLFLHNIEGQWIVLASVRYKDGTQF